MASRGTTRTPPSSPASRTRPWSVLRTRCSGPVAASRAAAPSPLRFGAAGHGLGSGRPVRRLIGAPTAPPLPCCAVTDRGSARGLGRRYAPRPQPAQVQAAPARSHSSRTFVTPRNMKRRRAIACLLAACRRITCGTRAGANSAAGRRGRRRSAYEAPRAAADGGPLLGGAESKRRRRPRLPAPPSRVTLLEQHKDRVVAGLAKLARHPFGLRHAGERADAQRPSHE